VKKRTAGGRHILNYKSTWMPQVPISRNLKEGEHSVAFKNKEKGKKRNDMKTKLKEQRNN
jgi:hypothetical protein